MIQDILIPEISENVASGTVVAVLVKVGDVVAADAPIVEFETEKAVVEIPSPVAGKITEILVQEGDEKNVGDVIARIDTQGEAGKTATAAAAEGGKARAPEEARPSAKEEGREISAPSGAEPAKGPEAEEPAPAAEAKPTPREQTATEAAETGKRPPAPAGPAARRLARELGVDIHAVRGTGPGGRITEADVKQHVKMASGGPRQPALPDFTRWGEIDTEPISTVRRITAEATVRSWTTMPHVTQFDEADITELQVFLAKNAGAVEKAGGKLTLTAVVMKVCAAALKKFPRFNSSIDMAAEKLIIKHYVHIGLMVETARGLLVPVVRNADGKSIAELAVEIVDLAGRARNKKIKPDEMEGGTFSISNQGGIGGSGFTPVILWPQAAVLGISRTATVARYRQGELVPRTILPLSLSYDHRIVDGADAARFMRWICECLEHPFTLHL